jgi:hypothetical protein
MSAPSNPIGLTPWERWRYAEIERAAWVRSGPPDDDGDDGAAVPARRVPPAPIRSAGEAHERPE